MAKKDEAAAATAVATEKTRRPRKSKEVDLETDAIRVCTTVLKPLSGAGRTRVLGYVTGRLSEGEDQPLTAA